VGDGNYNFTYLAILFSLSALHSDTQQGRVWNQTTQPELVAKTWQRRECAQKSHTIEKGDRIGQATRQTQYHKSIAILHIFHSSGGDYAHFSQMCLGLSRQGKHAEQSKHYCVS
jgi:hypothetical protein